MVLRCTVGGAFQARGFMHRAVAPSIASAPVARLRRNRATCVVHDLFKKRRGTVSMLYRNTTSLPYGMTLDDTVARDVP